MSSPPPSDPSSQNWNRRLLALAGPIVLANLSVPLPGIVDTAVMGHLPEASGLAAVGLGAVIFSTLFFAFGFLRMSTVAITAQAFGAGDWAETRATLYRSIAVAFVICVPMLTFQVWLGEGAFDLTDATDQVKRLGLDYFNIRIWGAPAALINMAMLGWLFGLGSMRIPVVVQIATNLINVVLDFLFVFGFGWGIEGVAAATVIAEWSGTLIGAVAILSIIRKRGGDRIPLAALMSAGHVRRLLGVNRDIFIRTLCLLIAFAHFKVAGTAFGTEVLAANIVLLIFLDLCSYGLDAFANAAEILVAHTIGRRDEASFRKVVRLSHAWAFAVAIPSTLVFLVLGDLVVAGLTDQASVREQASTYLFWAAIMPVTACWAFTIDGIYIGATWSSSLRNAMVVALVLYLAAQWVLAGQFGNHGLWAALNIFLFLRGALLGALYPRLARTVSGGTAGAGGSQARAR